MKKTLSLIMCIAMLLSACCVPFSVSAAGDLEITVGSVSAKPGETKTVNITVTANPGFCSATFSPRVSDSNGNAVSGITITELVYIDDEDDEDFGQTKPFLTVQNGSLFSAFTRGEKNVVFGPLDSNIKTTGILCSFTFTVGDSVPAGTYRIRFISQSCANKAEKDIPVVITEGTLTVTAADVESVSLNKSALGLNIGASETLTATVTPNNANQGVTWSSTDSTVASVDSNGKVTAIKEGTATITATSVADASKKATCTVTVACSHTNTTIYNAVESDCKTPGHAAYTKCNDCQRVIAGSDAPLPLSTNHVGGTATCIDKKVCTICGKPYGEVDKNNHVGGTTLKGALTESCKDPGYTGDIHCKSCDDLLTKGTTINPTGAHVDADGKWESNADQHFHTCVCGTAFDHTNHTGGTATCVAKKVCTACETAYGTVDKNNHVGGTTLKGALTESCKVPGYTGDIHCKSCDDLLTKGTTINPTGAHVDADGKWEVNADQHFHTCACGTAFDHANHTGGTATCVAKKVCVACETAYGTVDKNNHVGGTVLKGALTESCKDPGYTGDIHCKSCDDLLTKGTTINPTGAHVDADGKWEVNETQHFHTCRCGTAFDHNNHSGGTATCTAKKVCETCQTAYGTVDSTNHVGGTELRGVKEPCVYDGYTGDTYCLGCGTKTATGTAITATGSHVDLDGALNYDANNHFYLCKCCGEQYEVAAHQFDNDRDTTCDVCTATRRVGEVNVQTVDKRNNPFTDIALYDPYYNAVEYVYVKGLFKGVTETTFAPKATMTRAMFVTVLGRLAGVPETQYTSAAFTDVVVGEYYAPYIDWAAKNEIILGYGDGTFGVNDEITVEQVAVIMARYAKYIGMNTNAAIKLDTYRDGAVVADWAKAEMQWAVQNGVYVPAKSDTLGAKNDAARYIVAEVVYNFVTKFIG